MFRRDMVPIRVIEYLRRLRDTGELAPGDRLPSEREIAEHLAVGRNAVREAFKAMELAGMIEVRAGSGSYLTDAPDVAVDWLLAVDTRQRLDSIRQLLEVRRTVEVRVAELAALNATADHLEALKAAAAEMAQAVLEPQAGLRIDTGFHLALARASGNGLYVDIVRRCLVVLQSVRRSILYQVNPSALRRTHQEHERIAAAVEARDPDGARAAMAAHLDQVERGMTDLFKWGAVNRAESAGS
ncbi:MAG: FadR/GntR family transcriptional regulator [Thermaerobacter sp.]